jgi:hypothetical protein
VDSKGTGKVGRVVNRIAFLGVGPIRLGFFQHNSLAHFLVGALVPLRLDLAAHIVRAEGFPLGGLM